MSVRKRGRKWTCDVKTGKKKSCNFLEDLVDIWLFW